MKTCTHPKIFVQHIKLQHQCKSNLLSALRKIFLYQIQSLKQSCIWNRECKICKKSQKKKHLAV